MTLSYYCFFEVRKCELETYSALRKPVRKGVDMRYDFSSVPLKRRKGMTPSNTARGTSLGESKGNNRYLLRSMWFYFIGPNHPHQALQSNMYDTSGRPEGNLQHYYCTDDEPSTIWFCYSDIHEALQTSDIYICDSMCMLSSPCLLHDAVHFSALNP